MATHIKTVLATFTTALALSACSAASDVVTSAGSAATDVAAWMEGEFSGAGGRYALVVHPAFGDPDELRSEAALFVGSVAAEGGQITVTILDSGSASSARQLPLEGLTSGSMWPVGRNEAAHRESIATNTALVMAEIDEALAAADREVPGADLLGALELAARQVAVGPDDQPQVVALLTGGGTHRTGHLDLVDEFSTNGSLAGTDVSLTLPDSPMSIYIIGTGRFPAADRDVDPVFSTQVIEFWSALCQRTEASMAAACQVTESVPTNFGS